MKMFNAFICASLVSLSCQAGGAVKPAVAPTTNQQSTFGDLHSFFTEFDALFDDMYGWADDAVRRTESFFSSGTDDIFKRMRDESAQIHQRAAAGMRAMRQGSVAALQEAQQAVKRSIEELNNLDLKLDESIKNTKSFAQVSVKESGDDTDYTVLVTLPGYEEKNINVTISSKDTRTGGTKKQLKIDATKAVETKREVKEKDKKAVAMRSEQMCSRSVVGDRQQQIMLKDGVINIMLDLPANIGEEDYKMTFKNDVLSIHFLKSNKRVDETKSLNFSE